MNPASNTPPDGDFARYIEQLTAANAAKVLRQAQALAPSAPPSAPAVPQRASGAATAAARRPAAAGPPAPATPAALTRPVISGGAILGHLRWAIAIFVAVQFLGAIVPALGWLLVPALLAYAGWAVWQYNRASSGALFARLRELAEEAQQQQKRKP